MPARTPLTPRRPKPHVLFYPTMFLIMAVLLFLGLAPRIGMGPLNVGLALAGALVFTFAISRWDA